MIGKRLELDLGTGRHGMGWFRFAVQTSMVWIVVGAALADSDLATRAHDPGVREGAAGAGAPLEGISVYEKKFFLAGRSSLLEITSITGAIPETGIGLGPRFNLDSCGGCHAYPAPGGSSPRLNPQIRVANEYGAQNRIPSFITRDGPVRVARFKHADNGRADGTVHPLFTITGRTDQPRPTCHLEQPDFERARDNLSFRIPTPLFGLGLVEAVPESELLRNLAVDGEEKQKLGIAGRANRDPATGRITRFGWKAQHLSLLSFAGEAYSVELGVSNDLFPTETDETADCAFNSVPEDRVNYSEPASDRSTSEIELLAAFMRLLGPPYFASNNDDIENGKRLFTSVGCQFCHTPVLHTGKSVIAAINQREFQPYSDFMVHHMGLDLADDISQLAAGPDEFRTAPLWGLGQRIFFLHDGRTNDLLEAIEWHAAFRESGSVRPGDARLPRSEASEVIRRFRSLPEHQKQDLLSFLRSL